MPVPADPLNVSPLPRQMTAVEYPCVRYMVIENFKPGKVADIYRRLEQSGRQMPSGLAYVGSWITDDLQRCYQVMDCDDATLLDEWISQWADLMDFEVLPVISSDQAREKALRGT